MNFSNRFGKLLANKFILSLFFFNQSMYVYKNESFFLTKIMTFLDYLLDRKNFFLVLIYPNFIILFYSFY